MPCTPTSSDVISRVHLHICLLDVRFIADTQVLLCLRVWHRSTLHSVLVWLHGSLGGNTHWSVSLNGSHVVGPCRGRW